MADPTPTPGPGPRERIEAYFGACNEGSAADIAAHFTLDAVIWDSNLDPCRGAEAIGAGTRGILMHMFAGKALNLPGLDKPVSLENWTVVLGAEDRSRVAKELSGNAGIEGGSAQSARRTLAGRPKSNSSLSTARNVRPV